MEVPPDNELVIVCHCRPCRRPKGYKPRYDNDADDSLDLLENTPRMTPIRTLSDDAHFVDVRCPDATMTRNKWTDIPDGSIQIVWGQACPVYPSLEGNEGITDATLAGILANAMPKLKPNGRVVFPAPNGSEVEDYGYYDPGPGWAMELTTEFPFIVRRTNTPQRSVSGFIVFRKVGAGGRRRKTLKSRLRAAKKKCSPGYDVYDYRTNRKGEFFNCLPAGLKRRTLRRRT